MSKLLLLYGYNNYFNRIMKKKATFAEYKVEVGEGHYIELNDSNFNVTDGVNARHVFNTSSFLDGKSPDYLIRDFNGTLERWFVLESVKIMANQIQLSLRRDLVADFYEQIKVAPAFIQKGSLSYDSPFIFNKEGLNYNEIKKKEILLKDTTKTSWVVGYIARKLDGQSGTYPYTCVGKAESVTGHYIDYDDLPNYIKELLSEENVWKFDNSDLFLGFGTGNGGQALEWQIHQFDALQYQSYYTGKAFASASLIVPQSFTPQNLIEEIDESITHQYDTEDVFETVTQQNPTISNLDFNFYNNKVILKDGKTKRLVFTKVSDYNQNININISDLDSTEFGRMVKRFYNKMVQNEGFQIFIQAFFPTAKFSYKAQVYKMELVDEDLTDVTAVIQSSHNQLYDSPYDMFAIPMGNNMTFEISNLKTRIEGNIALSIARAIKLEMGSYIYDIQILPYCPFREVLDTEDNENILLDNLTLDKDYSFIKNEDDENINVILFPIRSRGSFDINVSDIEEFKLSENILERKVSAETIKARLVSPNFSGSFDFNPQKNNGVRNVNVDFNYRPYTPYIHIAPIFSGLYGEDFNDARGLICGGDFSITAVSSKWEEYQIQNKNYENIFNRQIENMDVNNSIAMEKTKLTGAINAASAAMGGGMAGYKVSDSAVGAGMGALIAGGLSVTAAIKDVEFLARQQSENRDYAIDMYTYNLQNIQALPYTLSKVSTYNENNKIFPFIEIYDCTDQEKQNLKNKIKYNGMTVMVQGKIEDYVINDGDYIQAQLIRLEGLDEDNHAIVEIYNELMKGVYIYG